MLKDTLQSIQNLQFYRQKIVNFTDNDTGDEKELLAAFPKEWKQQTYFYDFPHNF